MPNKNAEEIIESPTIPEKENIEEVIIEDKSMEKPKTKTKRPRSEAQIANFNKLQAANKIRHEARLKANRELGIADPIKKGTKNANDIILENKDAYLDNVLTKKKQIAIAKKKKEIVEIDSDSGSSDEEYIQPVKKTKNKKKRKPRIVIEDSTDSEQEIVISRRKRNKAPIKEKVKDPIIVDDDINKDIEKEKPVKINAPLKQYTHQQILKGLGL